MQSISVYVLTESFTIEENTIQNSSETTEEEVNGVMETLKFELYVNETIGSFTRCRVIIDEVIPLKARVLNRDITEAVVKNPYEIFINKHDGTLIILANKKSADIIHDFVTSTFNLGFEKKTFNLQTIIDNSSNVKKTQFRNLLIETINGSSLSGNRVTDTDMYELMLDAGELSTIAVVYPFNNIEIKFSVSDSGAIVLFSNVDTDEMLDWINILLS